MPNYEERLREIIKADRFIMESLRAVEQLKLEDAWISAGLIRNKV